MVGVVQQYKGKTESTIHEEQEKNKKFQTDLIEEKKKRLEFVNLLKQLQTEVKAKQSKIQELEEEVNSLKHKMEIRDKIFIQLQEKGIDVQSLLAEHVNEEENNAVQLPNTDTDKQEQNSEELINDEDSENSQFKLGLAENFLRNSTAMNFIRNSAKNIDYRRTVTMGDGAEKENPEISTPNSLHLPKKKHRSEPNPKKTNDDSDINYAHKKESLVSLHESQKSSPAAIPKHDKTLSQGGEKKDVIFDLDYEGETVIMGATLEKLVERLTSPATYDQKMLFQFLLTYRSFCTTQQLLDLLLKRYTEPKSDDVSQEQYGKEMLIIRVRVVMVMKKWLSDYWYDFSDQPEKLKPLLDAVRQTNSSNADELEKLIVEQKKGIAKERVISTKGAPEALYPKKLFDTPIVDFSITEIHPTEFARQLTIVEYKVYKNIKPSECLKQSWNKPGKEEKAPNILAMIKQFNDVSNWVATQVLKEDKLKKRVKVITHFVQIAESCKQLNNLNAVLEIISGLCQGSVDRLKHTWAGVHKLANVKQSFELLKALVVPTTNYKVMREYLKTVSPPCIPYIGIFLTDLIFVEEGNQDFLIDHPHCINFDKRRRLASVIEELTRWQASPYCLQAVPALLSFLIKELPRSWYSEKSLYERSWKYEARGGTS
eukprot:TRINITY_DN2091_c0_g1_i5.p1 TRINITY_DN2091_c0_g1~~TRINITY_DN2091_c0_g1_i5.p1  ORF type:complete len:655 (+),score=137.61 TRINITY_DN2091_c0_g1_i5:266-2230(+)